MKIIYTAVMARLKEKMPSLWVDLDDGVIDKAGGDRPGVSFPAALISVNLSSKDFSTGGEEQECTASVIVRLVQNPLSSRTNSEAAEEVRETALKRYDLIEEVYCALQSWENGNFNPLSRTRQTKEKRTDGLFVYRIEFQTEFYSQVEE